MIIDGKRNILLVFQNITHLKSTPYPKSETYSYRQRLFCISPLIYQKREKNKGIAGNFLTELLTLRIRVLSAGIVPKP
jgi:hypothetical protein